MPGCILQKGCHLADLRRGLPAVTVKEKPQDFLVALERQKFGDGANCLRIVASMDKGRCCDAKLMFPLLQSRRPRRTHGSVIRKIDAGEPIEKAIDVLLE